jgi:Arc/MetJ family transcription regulator
MKKAVKRTSGEATVRTNIIMEEPLVHAAQKATGIKTRTGVVHYALREVVRRQQMKRILLMRGKVKFWDGYVAEHAKP